ncbi:MAG TPA: phosphoglucosamine mutase [Ruminococcaceae bacterium]|nr:phosphoglucosamine mutase [Oscillospiraceae bacterium]
MGRIFGTDGIRGIANTELTPELAMNLGKACAMVVEERIGRKPRIIIGKDTRLSSDLLESAVCAGLCSAGADAMLTGVVPTPAVAYLVTFYGADAGIMLSASHNPFEYNGIKIFGSQGFKLTDEEENEIEEIILDNIKPYSVKKHGELGRVSCLETAVDDYVNHIKQTTSESFENIKIAVDCANGSASVTAAKLFGSLNAKFDIINAQPDGKNINGCCGSTHMEGLRKLVKSGKYDLGIAFDGDADRCLAVDENGEYVDGDKIIAIIAKMMKDEGRLKKNTTVVTVMSNIGYYKFAEENGIYAEKTKVGDRYVLENMLANGYNLGGEQSGHTIMLDYMPTGDGQLSAVQLLTAIKKSGKPLSRLANIMKTYPQVMVNVKVNEQQKSRLECEEVKRAIQEYEQMLGSSGRILVRASGTEPLVRVMAEGEKIEQIEEITNKIADMFRQ